MFLQLHSRQKPWLNTLIVNFRSLANFLLAFLLLACLHYASAAQDTSWRAGIVKVSAGKAPGTGVVVEIRPEFVYIVTAAHVVEGGSSPKIVFASDPDKKKYQAKISDWQGEEQSRGLALLQVENPHLSNLGVIDPAPHGSAVPNMPVTVAGFPVPIDTLHVLSATIGSVHGLDLNLSPQTGEGFSGGPVLIDGRVAGLVYGQTGDYGRAVSADVVQIYLRNLGVRWSSQADSVPASAPRTASQPEYVPSQEMPFGSDRFLIRYDARFWHLNGRPSSERAEFVLDKSKLSAILSHENAQSSYELLRQQAIDALGGSAAVSTVEWQRMNGSFASFYRLILVKSPNRYIYYLHTGEAGTLRSTVYGPSDDPAWSSGLSEKLLSGIVIK